jgi:hypothetical protein
MVAKILPKRWKHDRASATKSSDVLKGSADSLVAKVCTVLPCTPYFMADSHVVV